MDKGADWASRLDSTTADIGMGTEWQNGMPYLRDPIVKWPLNKINLGKEWERALPRDELKAKYWDLPGHLIMQILD